MREYVGLREFAGRPETALQFVKKPQIDVNPLVVGTIKRARRGFRSAASRLDGIPEEHKLRVAIRLSRLLRQELCPGFLRIVEHKRHKLHQRFLRGVSRMIGFSDGDRAPQRGGISSAEQSEEVGLEDKTENQEQDGAANADVHAAKLKPASAAGFIAAVLYVLAFATGCPSHGFPPSSRGKMVALDSCTPVFRNGRASLRAPEMRHRVARSRL